VIMASPPSDITRRSLLSRLRQFLAREYHDHGFTSDAFVAHELGIADPFPVAHIYFPVNQWRTVVLLRVLFQIWLVPYLLFLPSTREIVAIFCGMLCVILKITSYLLRKHAGLGDGSLQWAWFKMIVLMVSVSAPSRPQHELTRTCQEVLVLLFFSMTYRLGRLSHRFRSSNLWFFWSCYLVLGIRPSRFLRNYLAAWRLEYPDYEVALFVDRKTPVLRIPCAAPEDLDDSSLFKHLHHVHNLVKICGGAIPALLPKSPLRVEVIEVRHQKALLITFRGDRS